MNSNQIVYHKYNMYNVYNAYNITIGIAQLNAFGCAN